MTPKELLDHNKSGENWLPPPQLYESSRLNNEPDIDKIIPFAKDRGMNAPTTLIFPMHYHTKGRETKYSFAIFISNEFIFLIYLKMASFIVILVIVSIQIILIIRPLSMI